MTSGIRHQSAGEQRSPKWRQPTSPELRASPSDCGVSRYADAGGAQFHGSGHLFVVLFNYGFSHFVPVWHGGGGAGDGSMPTQQNLSESDGPIPSSGGRNGPGGGTALPQNPSFCGGERLL